MGIVIESVKIMSGKVAIVTGGNKGIGYAIVRGLMKSGQFEFVYLTARNSDFGKAAVEKLNSEEESKCHFHQLDVSDANSITAIKNYMVEKHSGFDVLVQNAGFAFKAGAKESRAVQTRETLKINTWGVLNLMKEFYPIIKENGRIVNMSSFVSQMTEYGGGWTPKRGHPIQREIGQLNKNLSLERLEEIIKKYESDCDKGIDEKEGWPQWSYGMSKLFVNSITKIYGNIARSDNKGVLINCCSPGYVKTDMTSQSGGTSGDIGARTSIWLSVLPPGLDGPQGSYLAEI